MTRSQPRRPPPLPLGLLAAALAATPALAGPGAGAEGRAGGRPDVLIVSPAALNLK